MSFNDTRPSTWSQAPGDDKHRHRHEHFRRNRDEFTAAFTMRGGGEGRGGGRFGGRGGRGFGRHGERGFGFPDDSRGGPFGPGPRVGRGDVRTAVLRLLSEGPSNGYQLIQELSQRSGGVWKPSPGSIYPALQQLEDEGLIRAEEIDGKRAFQLTDAGKDAAAKLGTGAAPWETASEGIDDQAMELRQLIQQVSMAVIQVMQAGTNAQVGKAKELMTGTRRSLYRILAEDDAEVTEDTVTL